MQFKALALAFAAAALASPAPGDWLPPVLQPRPSPAPSPSPSPAAAPTSDIHCVSGFDKTTSEEVLNQAVYALQDSCKHSPDRPMLYGTAINATGGQEVIAYSCQYKGASPCDHDQIMDDIKAVYNQCKGGDASVGWYEHGQSNRNYGFVSRPFDT